MGSSKRTQVWCSWETKKAHLRVDPCDRADAGAAARNIRPDLKSQIKVWIFTRSFWRLSDTTRKGRSEDYSKDETGSLMIHQLYTLYLFRQGTGQTS